MLAYLALTLAHLGYIDQALSRMDQALLEASPVQQRQCAGRPAPLRQLGRLAHRRTRHPRRGSPGPATGHGFPFFHGFVLAQRGRSLIVFGQAKEGFILLTQGLAHVRATGSILSTPMLLTWLAETCALLGQPAGALNSLAEAARVVETTEERIYEAELHRVRGDLLSASGDRSAAERHYRQAIAVAERQSAKLFQLRASTSLARLFRDQGKRLDARDLLGPIYDWFTEGFDAPDLKDAKALLDDLA
jgi:tetratricopeptide (TPR) repeat protein